MKVRKYTSSIGEAVIEIKVETADLISHQSALQLLVIEAVEKAVKDYVDQLVVPVLDQVLKIKRDG